MSDQYTIDGPPADVTNDGGSVDMLPPRPSKGRRLSWFRVFLVFAVAAAAITGVWFFGFRVDPATAGAEGTKSWFAPYVDVTATPQYAFEDVPAAAPTSTVLGFVVSATDAPCDPSWGTFYSMSTASDGLDLDRRVARLRQLGGSVTVSFGGAANSELSIGCTDPAALTAAYQSVVDRYSLLPGDLLFFSYSNSWRGIHHVAMYAGNGMMVEAPRTGLNVRLAPVRWSQLFQATRVFGSVPGVTEGPVLGSPDPDPSTPDNNPTTSPTTKPPTSKPTTPPTTKPTTPPTTRTPPHPMT